MPAIKTLSVYQPDISGKTYVLPAAIAGALFFFHVFFNLLDSYGIFRDEFYYLAATRRLAWGYVDHPPLSVFLLKVQTLILGDSLTALRVMPALAVSGAVFLSGRMVQLMRGGITAVALACVAVATAPVYIAMGSFYSMNSFDIFLWTAAACLFVLLTENPAPGYWLLTGVVMGLGLLNKVGFLWLGAGFFVGILFTPMRKQMLTPWPYLSAVIAFTIFSPFIFWNLTHEFAHLEFMQNAIANKYNGITRIDFIRGIFEILNPVSALVWLPGLYFYFFSSTGKNYRLLGILFLTVFMILLLNGHSKAEYIAPAFPVLYAGGAIFLEQKFDGSRRKWVPFLLVVLIFFTSLLLLPYAKPVLPPETFISYQKSLGFSQKNSEGKEVKQLPQFYADRFGWKELAETTSDVFRSLSPAEQKSALVFTQNYGEAGALEYYSRQYPLPPVVSGHNAYWHWPSGKEKLETLIIIGGEKKDHEETFDEVTVAAIHHSRYAMPYEDNLPVFICRKPKFSFKEAWKSAKKYD